MDANQIQSQPSKKDEDNIYLQIWRTEQDYTRTRWTVATFFMSVSFVMRFIYYYIVVCFTSSM